ncbi:MAG: class B sortase [Acetatifactor sp.]|nr:class B sortase [Acetatifactor sp.]
MNEKERKSLKKDIVLTEKLILQYDLSSLDNRKRLIRLIASMPSKDCLDSWLGIAFLKSVQDRGTDYEKSNYRYLMIKDLECLKSLVKDTNSDCDQPMVKKIFSKEKNTLQTWVETAFWEYYEQEKKAIERKAILQEKENQQADIIIIQKLGEKFNLNNQKHVDFLYDYLLGLNKECFTTWIGKNFLKELSARTSKAKAKRRKEKFWRACFLFFFFVFAILLENKIISFVKDDQNKIIMELAASNRELSERIQDAMIQLPKEEDAMMQSPKEGEDIAVEPKDNNTILEKYQKLYAINNEMVGWIEVLGTDINYPVMQGESEYYLTHGYDRVEQKAGAIFVDEKVNFNPNDNFIVLYGHNMKDGSMFGQLDNYLDQKYFNEHPEFQFDTLYEEQLYEIVAVLQTKILYTNEEGFRFYQTYHYQDEDTFNDIKKLIQEEQVYDTGIQLEYGDSLVLLSTCEYSVENGRLVVVGRKKQ